MAGIEKICEFSGEYPGGAMYGYKHNHLQIMPKYRKEFRHADHTLVISKSSLVLMWRAFRGSTLSSTYNPDAMQWYKPAFKSEAEYIKYLREVEKKHLVQEYRFELHVTDPLLQGEVKGVYLNWTCDLSTVKRKLKRMLRCRKLNIVYKVDDD